MFFLGGGDNRFIYASEFRDPPPPQPWKAAKEGKKSKATKAAAKKGAKRKRSADDAKPRHRNGGKPKLASWLKARPHGCGKCRYIPGCTRSCYLIRGEKVPK